MNSDPNRPPLESSEMPPAERIGPVMPGLDWPRVLSRAEELSAHLQLEIGHEVMGVETPVQNLLIGLLCEGHVLIEGVPGLAKTMLVRSFAEHLDLSFRRIQFTPDMLPSDILGSMVLDAGSQQLAYRPGPIFANVVLADEINRAPPKVQSALLEAMQERQVTIDGVSRPLPHPFMVVATQNPVELEGTYPLPEAELDRFMFRQLMDYPSEAKELEMLNAQSLPRATSTRPVVSPEELDLLGSAVGQVHVETDVMTYLARLVRATRADPSVLLGASPRCAVLYLRAARAAALLHGRTYVTPDDVKRLANPMLNHRLILRPEVLAQRISGGTSAVGDPSQRVVAALIDAMLAHLTVPR